LALTREFAENFLDLLVAFVALEINLESHYGDLMNDRDRLGRERKNLSWINWDEIGSTFFSAMGGMKRMEKKCEGKGKKGWRRVK